jgi:hypothetical protein
MDYTEDFLAQKKKEAESLLYVLEQCKYAGMMDGRVNVNDIIKVLGSYVIIVDGLKKTINELIQSIKTISESVEVKK